MYQLSLRAWLTRSNSMTSLNYRCKPQKRMTFTACWLQTTTIGFSPDADHFIQMTGHRQPLDMNIWHASDVTLTFLDRTRPTCVRGLIEARLPEIKATCRYNVHKPPYPRSVNRLHSNTFLLTIITQLRFQCPTQQFGNNDIEIQTIHKFDCHCNMIHAYEFSIVPDLDFCNNSEDITVISTIHYPINLAYLSKYFTIAELFNLTANTLLNHSIEIQLPNLAIEDKFLDGQKVRRGRISSI